jgi:exodeoxyribonuclease VIII
MVDLETLGVSPGCMILSIGAVEFDPRLGELGRQHYNAIDLGERHGLHEHPDTMEFWRRQSEVARKVFDDPARVTLTIGLQTFNEWLPQDALVWGNGADFDNAILAAAYYATGMRPGWRPYNGRCYRTVKNLAPHIKLARKGEHHNALDDAISQAQHLMDIVQQTTLTLA